MIGFQVWLPESQGRQRNPARSSADRLRAIDHRWRNVSSLRSRSFETCQESWTQGDRVHRDGRSRRRRRRVDAIDRFARERHVRGARQSRRPDITDTRRRSASGKIGVEIDGRWWSETDRQSRSSLRSMRHRLSRSRAAAVQLQSSARRLPDVRRLRRYRSMSTWTWSCPTHRFHWPRVRSHRGRRPPIDTNSTNCLRWRTITTFPSMSLSGNSRRSTFG